MEYHHFLSEISDRTDLLPKYMSNQSCNPAQSSKKPEKISFIMYDNSLHECPEMPGDSILISDICPLNHEHFCGGIHIPQQENTSPKGRLAHAAADKIIWPCGLRSMKINDREIEGYIFVKCRCGNLYPTWIPGERNFFFITCCANDTAAVKLGKTDGDKCQNCSKLNRWYFPGLGFNSDVSQYKTRFFCPACTPIRDLVSNMTRFGSTVFKSPSYTDMQKNYEWKRNLPNNSEIAFRALNSPFIQTSITTCSKIDADVNSMTVTELVASVNRTWNTEFKIIPINRTKVLFKDYYRGKSIIFHDNDHLHNQILLTLTDWHFL
uniref:Nonstructural protein NSP1-2 n=1 Tax=Rotavirus B (isolate RVB/Human/China/ADRV/1982) TaxID=10942 RepID=I7FH01_ROTGA|nr:nonstructural protein NSP1-2 [Human rotavirus B]